MPDLRYPKYIFYSSTWQACDFLPLYLLPQALSFLFFNSKDFVHSYQSMCICVETKEKEPAVIILVVWCSVVCSHGDGQAKLGVLVSASECECMSVLDRVCVGACVRASEPA